MMKKTTLLIAICTLLMGNLFAGGILTNMNQSAQYVRMLSRNASTELDAVYFNPAGLTLLEDGFYGGIHNQTIFQYRTIESGFPGLNGSEYKGDVKALLFPSLFAAYKKNNWVFSLGFGLNGGGGTAEFDRGIPTFEKPLALLAPGLQGIGVPATGYEADLFLDAWSVFFGTQLNASYKINDVISASAGFRYIRGVNTYEGHIRDINVIINGTSQSASDFFNGLAAQANQGVQLLSQYPAEDPIPPNIAALTSLPDGLTFGQGVAALTASAASAIARAQTTADVETDTKQTGNGFAPLLGLNLSLDKLNIGVRYEFKTSLTLTNDTKIDGTGFFPDGEKDANDIPAILAVGADYMISDAFKISVSYNNYFDKAFDWGNNVYGQEKTFDHNMFEIAVGLEYALNDKWKISVGGMHTNTGVTEQYQSDFTYSNSAYTGGFGCQYKINNRLTLDAGFLHTTYIKGDKTLVDENVGSYKETYDKRNFDFAIGINYKFF